MKKQEILKTKLKSFFAICSCLAVFALFCGLSLSKYLSIFRANGSSTAVAKPIVEMYNDSVETNIVDGGKIEKYFTIFNYNTNETTEIGLDYYIYIVNENNEVIDNATLYYQTDADNPNEFSLVTKITEGKYAGYFNGGDFTVNKEKHDYKLIINEVSGYSKVYVKVIAVQKGVG